jgi:hypothetical protein
MIYTGEKYLFFHTHESSSLVHTETKEPYWITILDLGFNNNNKKNVEVWIRLNLNNKFK